MHQIHFLVLEQNGKSVDTGQYLDTVQVPYWSGTGLSPASSFAWTSAGLWLEILFTTATFSAMRILE